MNKLALIPAVLLLWMLCACGAPSEAGPAENIPAEPEQTGEPEAPPEPPAAEEPEDVPPVFADFSRLEGSADWEEPCRQYWGEPMLEFRPDDGYGCLVPYVGAEQCLTPVQYPEYGRSKAWYGLATIDGDVVTEPIYSGVYPLYYLDAQWTRRPVPAYAVCVEQPADGDTISRYQVIARDGSWCTDACYRQTSAVDKDRILLVDADGASWFCDLEGNLTPTAVEANLLDLWGEEGPAVGTYGSSVEVRMAPEGGGSWLVNFETGRTAFVPDLYYGGQWPVGVTRWPAAKQSEYGYLDPDGTWAIPAQYAAADRFCGAYALVTRMDNRQVLIDTTGAVAMEPQGSMQAISAGGTTYYAECDAAGVLTAVYDAALEPVEMPGIGKKLLECWEGILWRDETGVCRFWNGSDVYPLPENVKSVSEFRDGRLFAGLEDQYGNGLYDVQQGRWTIEPTERYLYWVEDWADGEFWPVRNGNGSPLDHVTVYTPDGEEAFRCQEVLQLTDGVFSVRSGVWGGLMDADGQWLLRRMIRSTGD